MPKRETDSDFNLDELIGKKSINIGQKSAILKTLQTDSYSLIEGMPGTGKTRTICMLVDVLIKLGKRVLVTSFTHTALDNILIKFK